MPHNFVSQLRSTDADHTVRRGLWVTFLSAYALEAALSGTATETPRNGPDWIGIDLQHGDLAITDVSSLLRVTERAGIPTLARMPSHDAAAIAKVLDAGVDGVIIPGVESRAEAEALRDAVRLPPHGRRSTGTARSSFGVTTTVEPLLLAMVETRAGLEAAADIAGVPGVDGLFVGPYDLSMSLGVGSPSHPEVTGAIRDVAEIARATSKSVGLYAGRPDLLAVSSSLDLVAVDSDVSALRSGLGLLFS